MFKCVVLILNQTNAKNIYRCLTIKPDQWATSDPTWPKKTRPDLTQRMYGLGSGRNFTRNLKKKSDPIQPDPKIIHEKSGFT